MEHKNGRALLAAIILVVPLFIAGIAQAQTKNLEEIVAWVNNDIILKSEFEMRKSQVRDDLSQPAPRGRGLQGAQLDQAFAEQSKRVLQSLIDETLLLQQAKDLGLTADIEIVKTMDRLRIERKLATTEELEKEIVAQGYSLEEFKQNIRVQYLSSQVLQREVYPKVIVTTDEVHKYYDAHVKDFDRPAGIRVREITIITENRGPEEIASQRKKAEDALAAAKKGDDFADVAGKYSESQTAQEGGDLGFFAKGELNSVLEEVTDKLEKGQVSDIISVPGAFMILKLEDKHNGGVLPFELAQKEVFDVLWQQAVRPKISEYLTKLRTDGFVKVADGYVDTGAPQKNEKVSEAKD
jgi:peptidyl-prolyl cis-trans isomerase SurA